MINRRRNIFAYMMVFSLLIGLQVKSLASSSFPIKSSSTANPEKIKNIKNKYIEFKNSFAHRKEYLTDKIEELVQNIKVDSEQLLESEKNKKFEINTFKKNIEIKRKILDELRDELENVKNRPIHLPLDDGRVKKIKANIEVYEQALEQMTNNVQINLDELNIFLISLKENEKALKKKIENKAHTIESISSYDHDETENILINVNRLIDIISSQITVYSKLKSFSIVDIISAQYDFENEKLRHAIDLNKFNLKDYQKQLQDIYEESVFEFAYTEGKKNVKYSDIYENSNTALEQIFDDEDDVKYCLKEINTHLYNNPQTESIHIYFHDEYLVSLKFKKEKVALKYYKNYSKVQMDEITL